MRLEHDAAARGLVAAAAFHADIAVLDHVEPSDPVPAADGIEFREDLRGGQAFPVHRHDVSAAVLELDLLRLRRRFLRRHRDAPHRFLRLVLRVLEHAAFIGDVQQIRVHGVGRAAFLPFEVDRDAVLFGIAQQLLPREQVPFAPRRDDVHVGHQRVGSELEAHLVVALAGGAVRNGVGACFIRHFHELFCDKRASDRGPQQILAFVHGVGAEHRKHEIAHELLAQILDEDLLDAELLCFLPRRLELFPLPDVGGEGDHLAAVLLLQPLQDHRSVEAAGVGEDGFPNFCH